MLLSLRKNGLPSSFKKVRVFKIVSPCASPRPLRHDSFSGSIQVPCCQGQVFAEGISHLANPNLGSDSGMRIFLIFVGPMLSNKKSPSKIHPQEIHRPKFTSKILREEEGTQTQTFWSGYFRVGWGSST